MGWFSSDDHQDAYDQFNGNPQHKASLSHELLGGALAYEATKAYEDHCAKNGHPDNHAKAKEIMAGLAGAAFDRFAETKGLDAWDNFEAKRAARQNACQRLEIDENIDVNYNNNY